MFELSVACKYLIPRRRQLSVSIISLISVLVITLVVWLIVVFFSVTDGLEKNWVHKLTALTAPVRITPTDAYYHSYYYQVDSLSEHSGYSHKTIREKKDSSLDDPYNPDYDEEIPAHWPTPDKQPDGSLKNLVHLAYASIDELQGIAGLKAQDFELTAGHIRVKLLRDMAVTHAHNLYGGTTQSYLAYPSYLGNFEPDNPHFGQTLLPLEAKDLNNYLQLIAVAESPREDQVEEKVLFPTDTIQKRLRAFFDQVTIKQLQARPFGWTIPRFLLPTAGKWEGCAVLKEATILRVVIPGSPSGCSDIKKALEEQGLTVLQGQLNFDQDTATFSQPNQTIHPLSPHTPLTFAAGTPFSAHLIASSLDQAKKLDDVQFEIALSLQGILLKGSVPFRGLEIASAEFARSYPDHILTDPFWVHQRYPSLRYTLPKDPDVGEGIVLPKSFREAGVLAGDRGHLSYFAATASLLQEQYLPVYVAGFYDPGIIPIGGKFILASPEATSIIRASHQQEDKAALTNGINVRFDRLEQAEEVKAQLVKAFQNKEISRYWDVQTYREYEFTREIMQELQSQKNIFMLIAIVIIIVACSNIISMLIILVNDKKVEIGILRSMGASSKSIALIFGLAGAAIGVLGSALGILAAILTLNHLGTLIAILSHMQGYDLFNASFYGQGLPHELSYEALLFVFGATCAISLLAGIVPAIKACLLRPSQILRSSGG